MIRFYLRLLGQCQTVNQVNQLHTALDKRLTPAQWQSLSSELIACGHADSESGRMAAKGTRFPGADWTQQTKSWESRIQEQFEKAPYGIAQTFVRKKIGRNLVFFTPQHAKPDGRVLVVCFTGLDKRMMVPLPIFLAHIDASENDVVLVNYPHDKGFRSGLTGVANTFEGMLVQLAEMLDVVF